MLGIHALIAIGEAVITVAAVSAVLSTRPDLVAPPPVPSCGAVMKLFTIIALAVAIGLATAASPFASSHPDGLEQVAEDKGVPRDRRRRPEARPITDYAFPGVDDERVATGLAGLRRHAGVFGLASGSPPWPGGDLPHERTSHDSGVAGDPQSPIHRLDPRAKLIGLAGDHARRRSPRRSTAWPAYVACAAALVVARALARVPHDALAARRVVLPLVLFVAVFVPFVRQAIRSSSARSRSPSRAWRRSRWSAPRPSWARCSAVLLGATTSFPDVLHALERCARRGCSC